MLLERMRNGWWGGGQLEVGMGRRYIYAKKSRISHGTQWKRAKSNQGRQKKPKFEFLRGNVVFRGVQSAFGGKWVIKSPLNSLSFSSKRPTNQSEPFIAFVSFRFFFFSSSCGSAKIGLANSTHKTYLIFMLISYFINLFLILFLLCSVLCVWICAMMQWRVGDSELVDSFGVFLRFGIVMMTGSPHFRATWQVFVFWLAKQEAGSIFERF